MLSAWSWLQYANVTLQLGTETWGVQDKDSPKPTLNLSGGQRCDRPPKFFDTSGCRTGHSTKQLTWKVPRLLPGSGACLLVPFVHWWAPTTEGLLFCAHPLAHRWPRTDWTLRGSNIRETRKAQLPQGTLCYVVLEVSTGYSRITKKGTSFSLRGSQKASKGRE